MKLLTVEPTPSPNVMKLSVDESLPQGVQRNYTSEASAGAPPVVRRLLGIRGVKSVFHTADFIALERGAGAAWPELLAEARAAFEAEAAEGGGPAAGTPSGAAGGAPAQGAGAGEAGASFGEANVLVQAFRGIPIQIRVRSGAEEARISMPDRFTDAATRASAASPNLIRERKLEEYGVRYGDLSEIAQQVSAELDASFDNERLEAMVREITMRRTETPQPPRPLTREEIAERLQDQDWKVRYAALDRMIPHADDLPLLTRALKDPQFSIRRLAVVYIGGLKDELDVLPYLYEAMEDSSAAVRRTAGDSLSDIGDSAATPVMAKALADPSKIVRWRAARFLYEVGDDRALEALREATRDPEFEVSLQATMALERIERGEAAAGTVWQQMTKARS